jgi:integrase
MRLMECVRLRVKDVEFERREIVVRAGKGNKDRVTMLPVSLMEPLKAHLDRVRETWLADRAAIRPGVELPDALNRKYQNAATEWGWFWVFPAPAESTDPRSGIVRRHHIYEQNLQRAVKRAVIAACIAKPAPPTRCAIRLPRIYCSRVTTSAPCRNCSAIPMFPPR